MERSFPRILFRECSLLLPQIHAIALFQMGQDDVIDLIRGWGPRNEYPLNLDKLPEDQLSKVAFLFGGVGDGESTDFCSALLLNLTYMYKAAMSSALCPDCLKHTRSFLQLNGQSSRPISRFWISTMGP